MHVWGKKNKGLFNKPVDFPGIFEYSKYKPSEMDTVQTKNRDGLKSSTIP